MIPALSGTTLEPLGKHNSKSFDLSTQPGTDNALTYKMTGHILDGNEDLRPKLKWVRDTKAIITGVHAQNLEPKRGIVKALTVNQTFGVFQIAMQSLPQVCFDAQMEAAIIADTANGNTNQQDALNAQGVTQHANDVEAALTLHITEMKDKLPNSVASERSC